MSTCRAAVFNGDGTYEIRDFALPTPAPVAAYLNVEAADYSYTLGDDHRRGSGPRPYRSRLPRHGENPRCRTSHWDRHRSGPEPL